MTVRRRWLAVLAALAFGCDAPATPDAGVPTSDAGRSGDPALPTLPTFTPCPEGWSAVATGDGYDVCEPPAALECTGTDVRFIDQAACAPVGAACPSGEWADPPDGARVVYVRAGASGGTGTMAAPFGSIQQAILQAPTGAVILLGKGTYDEAVDLYGGLTLLGACAAETILAPAGVPLALRANERGSRAEDLTIRPPDGASGVEVTGELALESVIIENAGEEGILVRSGGSLRAESIVVRDIHALTPLFGRGILVTEGTADVHRAVFERCPGAGIVVGLGGQMRASGIVVRDSGQELLGHPQIVAQGVGGTLELSDSVLEDAIGGGVLVSEDGVLHADQVVMRRLRYRSVMDGGSGGILVKTRAHLDGTRLRVEDCDYFGIGTGRDASASIHDTLIRRIDEVSQEGTPVAIGILTGGPGFDVQRVVLSDIARTGLQSEARAGGTLEDVTVLRVGSPLRDIYPSAGFAFIGGEVSLRRALVREQYGVGLMTEDGTELTLEDFTAEDLLTVEDGAYGRGIAISSGTATLSRIRIVRAREIALQVSSEATATAEDVSVSETLGRSCQDTTCADAPAGIGIGVFFASSLEVTRFTVDGARLCGAMLALDGQLDLRQGEVRASTFGACVQVAPYDVTRLTDTVQYVDCETNLDATEHMVPPPLDPLSSLEL